MPVPYVGVSGVVAPEQQQWVHEAAEPILEKGRKLLLGVKAVHKTHWLEQENKYGPYHYPVGSSITTSLSRLSEGEMGVAQVYLDLKQAAIDGEQRYEERFVEKLLGRNASWLTGIQFDMLPWHQHDYTQLLQMIKDRDHEVLLQCYGKIMEQHSPSDVKELLKKYSGLVDYVLLDASHGQGKRLDVEQLQPFIAELSAIDGVGLGIAGGLNAKVVLQELPALLAQYPDLSFDAEGNLRLPENGESALDRNTTTQYLQAAAQVI